MIVLVGILIVLACAVAAVGAIGLAGRLPENSLVGVRTEQTLSDPLLWRTANRVAGPGLIAAGVIVLGAGLAALAMSSGWSYLLLGVGAVAAFFLAGFGALQGARAASIQAALQLPDSTCCSAADDGATGSGGDPAADCGVPAGCGACALQGMCDHERNPA